MGSHQGTMHCSSSYHTQCAFASSKWQCDDIQNPCNNYTSSYDQSLNIESENFVESISDLDSLWYIIGAIIVSLCLFLCLLLCLIRRLSFACCNCQKSQICNQ